MADFKNRTREDKLFSLKLKRRVWQVPLNMLPKACGHTHTIQAYKQYTETNVKKIISGIWGANSYKELKGEEPIRIVTKKVQRNCK